MLDGALKLLIYFGGDGAEPLKKRLLSILSGSLAVLCTLPPAPMEKLEARWTRGAFMALSEDWSSP